MKSDREFIDGIYEKARRRNKVKKQQGNKLVKRFASMAAIITFFLLSVSVASYVLPSKLESDDEIKEQEIMPNNLESDIGRSIEQNVMVKQMVEGSLFAEQNMDEYGVIMIITSEEELVDLCLSKERFSDVSNEISKEKDYRFYYHVEEGKMWLDEFEKI